MAEFNAMPMPGSGGFTPMPGPDQPKDAPAETVAQVDISARLLARSQDLRSTLAAQMSSRLSPIPEPRRLRRPR